MLNPMFWLVRNGVGQVLQWSKRARPDVSLSILVYQRYKGANVGGDEHGAEIRTDGEATLVIRRGLILRCFFV